MKLYAILLAAGTGARTGLSIPKQLIKIKNKEIIIHSLEIFAKSSIKFDGIIVVIPPRDVFNFNWKSFFNQKARDIAEGDRSRLYIITGGGTRQDSANNAVKYLENILPSSEVKDAVVFIHDSARPFVTDGELNLLLNKTIEHGAAFLCSATTETIKEIKGKLHQTQIRSNPVRLKTLNRDRLISAKTPQAFKLNIIKKAFEEAARIGLVSTDDISLVENLGLNIVPILSTDSNIKITTALDIEIAEFIYDKLKLEDC
ncbi:IspD/TarI family cytidylyltransferase [Candidatus Acidulodesulfobacterium sp. H_13]|uniref:IspD/TarI family cytidylyltransferase n=1 Tax=Candidatus Acidulodesulfobacterium sp. H_13 TaxID=3395470 RepID=UPI003AF6F6DB